MNFESKTMWADLDSGDEAVLTNNGKPAAIIIDIPEGHFDETVQAVHQAKTVIALNGIRQKAAKFAGGAALSRRNCWRSSREWELSHIPLETNF